jgi:hypothetical protein
MDMQVSENSANDTEELLINLNDDIKKANSDSSDTSSATEKEDNAQLSDKDELDDKESQLDNDGEVVKPVTEYMVEGRDTLNSIAAKHNTTPSMYVIAIITSMFIIFFLLFFAIYYNIACNQKYFLFLRIQIKTAQSVIVRFCVSWTTIENSSARTRETP